MSKATFSWDNGNATRGGWPGAGGSGPGIPGGAPPSTQPNRWWILVIIAIAQLMIVLDATIMNIALPSAQRSLHFSVADRQWVVTAYALAFGSLLLLGGRLADLFGRKVTFLVGLIGFAGASAVGGASTSFAMLATARTCQGAFAALLAPSALSLLATTFVSPQDRRRAFGVYGAIAGAGGAVGLVLGGLLTEYLSWRWCLYVNLLFASIVVIGSILLLRRQQTIGRIRLDLPGALLVSGGMFCVVYGFSNTATHSWRTPSTWTFLAAGAILLVLFVLWQTRATQPLLPLRILADRNRAAALIAMFLSGAGLFGILLFLNYYMQENLHYSPVVTGLAFLPMVGVSMAMSNVSNVVLMPRIGPRPLVVVGMLLAGISAALLTSLGLHSSYPSGILPSVLLAGAGLGLIIAPMADTGTSGVPPRDTGVVSAAVNTSNQLGGSVGTSLLNSIFASSIAAYFASNFRPGPVGNSQPSQQFLAAAQVHGYTVAFWWCAGIYGAGMIICGALLRWGPLAKVTDVARSREPLPEPALA